MRHTHAVDPLTLLKFAAVSANLTRNLWAIKKSARTAGATTHATLEYNQAFDEMELAASTDRPEERNKALDRAEGLLRTAAAQVQLPATQRGFACSLLASFSERDSDRGAAKLWARRALAEYDSAFTELLDSHPSETDDPGETLDRERVKSLRGQKVPDWRDLAKFRIPFYRRVHNAYSDYRMGRAREIVESPGHKEVNSQAQATANLAHFLGEPVETVVSVIVATNADGNERLIAVPFRPAIGASDADNEGR